MSAMDQIMLGHRLAHRRQLSDISDAGSQASYTGGKRVRPVLSVDTDLASKGRARVRSVRTVQKTKTEGRRAKEHTGRSHSKAGKSQGQWTRRRSPNSASSKTGSLNAKTSVNKVVVQAPTIFITPSREVYEYSPPAAQVRQGSANGCGRKKSLVANRESTMTCFEEDLESAKRERVTSGMTVFEEDVTPKTTLSIGSKMSGWTPVTATPRRSRGWWNVITTPFATSATSAKFSAFSPSPIEEEKGPEVPALPPYVFIPAGGPTPSGRPRRKSDTKLGIAYALQKPGQDTYMRKLRDTSNDSSPAESRVASSTVTKYLSSINGGQSQEHIAATAQPDADHAGRKRADTLNVQLATQDLSPYDREVPFMLGMDVRDLASHDSTLKLRAQHSADASNRIYQDRSPVSALTMSTPESRREDFSPMVQIAPTGTVVAGKPLLSGHKASASVQNAAAPVIQRSPDPTLSMRSSQTAQLFHVPAAEIYRQHSHATATRAAPTEPIRERPSSFVVLREQIESAEQRDMVMHDLEMRRLSGETVNEKDAEEADPRKLRKQRKAEEKRKRKRCCICCICWTVGVILLIILIILLAILVPRAKSNSNVTNIWANITGFPPVPTGVLTVARPNLVNQVSGCANPAAMWSCAIPKEQQADIVPNNPDQPNFVLNIMYNNSTSGSASSLGFQPAPAVPLLDEQQFLGNTTDGNSLPAEGEVTPFYISFLSSTSGAANNVKVKRQDSSSEDTSTATIFSVSTSTLTSRSKQQSLRTSTSSDTSTTSSSSPSTTISNSSQTSSAAASTSPTISTSIPNFATAIPLPSTNPDGTALPANLLPFPSYQPLRLYNRGLPTEHYGFYTYYDRNIFMRSISLQNNSQQMLGDIPADAEGGSAQVGATARCTWRETRFKVQIWTRMNMQGTNNTGNGTSLLGTLPASTISTAPGSASVALIRPGTFPLPITVTIDRHGGSLTRKMLFCYGLDERGRVDVNARLFQPEDRAFVPAAGGVPFGQNAAGSAGGLVNPTLGPFQSVNVSKADGGPGGIDGGVGGCGCAWQNF